MGTKRGSSDLAHSLPQFVHKFAPVIMEAICSDVFEIEISDLAKKSFVPFIGPGAGIPTPYFSLLRSLAGNLFCVVIRNPRQAGQNFMFV
jgi:hypothetical protein